MKRLANLIYFRMECDEGCLQQHVVRAFQYLISSGDSTTEGDLTHCSIQKINLDGHTHVFRRLYRVIRFQKN